MAISGRRQNSLRIAECRGLGCLVHRGACESRCGGQCGEPQPLPLSLGIDSGVISGGRVRADCVQLPQLTRVLAGGTLRWVPEPRNWDLGADPGTGQTAAPPMKGDGPHCLSTSIESVATGFIAQSISRMQPANDSPAAMDRPEDSSFSVEKQSEMTDDPTNHVEHMGQELETTAEELPSNYYRSVYFCGTMVACGASFASVSSTCSSYGTTNIEPAPSTLPFPPSQQHFRADG